MEKKIVGVLVLSIVLFGLFFNVVSVPSTHDYTVICMDDGKTNSNSKI